MTMMTIIFEQVIEHFTYNLFFTTKCNNFSILTTTICIFPQFINVAPADQPTSLQLSYESKLLQHK